MCSDFALDIIVADYSISIERRDDGACCTCACCLAGICACPLGCCSTCNDRQLQLVAYAHLGGCQTSGCDLWGMYQVSLVNNLQITIEGSGGLSECPANVRIYSYEHCVLGIMQCLATYNSNAMQRLYTWCQIYISDSFTDL